MVPDTSSWPGLRLRHRIRASILHELGLKLASLTIVQVQTFVGRLHAVQLELDVLASMMRINRHLPTSHVVLRTTFNGLS